MTEIAVNEGYVRPMSAVDLEKVLEWRNHPNIRRYMLTQHEISPDEHRHWFIQASQDVEKLLLIFEVAGIPIGFAHFTGQSRTGSANWGFYSAPNSPKGTGRKLGNAALNYAFEIAGFHKVCGQALAFNRASIRLHYALGFQQEGLLRQQYYMGDIYYDLICFGLLQNEWTGEM